MEKEKYFSGFGIKILCEEFDEIDSLVLLIVKYEHYENFDLDMLPIYEMYGDNTRVVSKYKNIFYSFFTFRHLEPWFQFKLSIVIACHYGM